MNERKQHVLNAAKRLFLENGFANTSIQNILDEAGISKGTFYNYFSSKNECLISIIDESKESAEILRSELSAAKRDGPDLLAEQILVRLRMNREQKIIRLYEAILHSGDPELREYMKAVHLSELSWLERRLTEVYGDQFRPYAADAALMQFGILGQYLQFAPDITSVEELSKRIFFVIKRTEALLRDMEESNEHLLENGQFTLRAASPPLPSPTRIAEDLLSLADTLPPESLESGREFAVFLSGELKRDKPRRALLKTVAVPFRKLFDGRPNEPEARTVMSALWNLLKSDNMK